MLKNLPTIKLWNNDNLTDDIYAILVDHGICYIDVENNIDVSKIQTYFRKFFSLDQSELKKVRIDVRGYFTDSFPRCGYSGSNAKQIYTWFRPFVIDNDNSNNNWLDSHHQKICVDWSNYIYRIESILNVVFSKILDFPEFALLYGNSDITATQAIFYPKFDNDFVKYRFKPHIDMGIYNILFVDDAPGFQIMNRSDKKWYNVEKKENCFILNSGLLLQRMTNDKFYAVPHRVIDDDMTKSKLSFSHQVSPKTNTNILIKSEKYGNITTEKYIQKVNNILYSKDQYEVHKLLFYNNLFDF